jgi:hypothetical protein
VFAPSASGAFVAAGGTVPGIAVPFPGLALSNTGWLDPVQVTGDAICIARGRAVAGEVISGPVAAKDTAPGLRRVGWGIMAAKGRALTRGASILLVGMGMVMWKTGGQVFEI